MSFPGFNARQVALPGALAAAAATIFVLAGSPLHTFADALGRALDADPRWVVAGAIFELLSFGGYIALLWLVGGRATDRLGLRASTEVTLGGAAATRLLPAGGAGGAAVTLWSLRRAGLTMREAAHTLLTFLVLLYSVFLGSIAVAGGLIALGIVDGWRAAAAERAAGGRGDAGHRRRPRHRGTPPAQRAHGCARRRRAGGDRAGALRRRAPARRPGLVGVRRRRAVGDAARARRAAIPGRRRARLLPRPGRQHDPPARRCQRRHGRRAAGLRGRRPTWRSPRCLPTARWRSGCRRRSAWRRSAACGRRSPAGVGATS